MTRHRKAHSRSVGRSATVCVLAVSCLWARPTSARERAIDAIEPQVNRDQFAVLLHGLNLEDDQRMIAELLFRDYSSALSDLAGRLDEQAEQAGRAKLRDSLDGSARLGSAEARRIRAAVLRVYQEAWPGADATLEELLTGLRGVITPAQEEPFAAAVRRLRREVFLHARQERSRDPDYAGDGVDVIELAELACADGGEFHPLGLDPLADVLGEYEAQLDELLIKTAVENRRSRLARRLAELEGDRETLARESQSALERWEKLYRLNAGCVERIGEWAAAHLGESARLRWHDRFHHACFPWLFQSSKPDRAVEEIRRQIHDADTLQRAESIYAEYAQQREALSRQAIDLMLRSRLEFQTVVYAMLDPAEFDHPAVRLLYEDLLKNSGAQADLDARTSANLEALLAESKR